MVFELSAVRQSNEMQCILGMCRERTEHTQKHTKTFFARVGYIRETSLCYAVETHSTRFDFIISEKYVSM